MPRATTEGNGSASAEEEDIDVAEDDDASETVNDCVCGVAVSVDAADVSEKVGEEPDI